MREKVLKAEVKDRKNVVQRKSKAIFNETKATDTHWRENLSVVKLIHAAERRTALEKSEESRQNETLQLARDTRAEKVSAGLQGQMRKMMVEKDLLTAQSDERALENQCVPGLAQEAKKAWKLCVEVQRLKEERARVTGPIRPVRLKKTKRARGVFSGRVGTGIQGQRARQNIERGCSRVRAAAS